MDAHNNSASLPTHKHNEASVHIMNVTPRQQKNPLLNARTRPGGTASSGESTRNLL
jgi:hypothetical protein